MSNKIFVLGWKSKRIESNKRKKEKEKNLISKKIKKEKGQRHDTWSLSRMQSLPIWQNNFLLTTLIIR